MVCEHDLADKESACADGMCPICIAAEVEELHSMLGQAVAAERERIATKFVVWAGVHAVPFKAAMDFAVAIRRGE